MGVRGFAVFDPFGGVRLCVAPPRPSPGGEGAGVFMGVVCRGA